MTGSPEAEPLVAKSRRSQQRDSSTFYSRITGHHPINDELCSQVDAEEKEDRRLTAAGISNASNNDEGDDKDKNDDKMLKKYFIQANLKLTSTLSKSHPKHFVCAIFF